MNIVVVGMGYVGLSNAVLLSQRHNVTVVDIVPEKVAMLNRKISPIADKEIEEYLATRELQLIATTDADNAYRSADIVIVSTPTNYDEIQNCFDTSSVDRVVDAVYQVNPTVTVVVKSTIPVGYTEELYRKHGNKNLLFSPEFLRENKALYDNLYPSRIIVGYPEKTEFLTNAAAAFAQLLKEGAIKEEISVLLMRSTEAEAVKLFSNTYLALRVSYFNELDTYAELKGLDTRSIIEGVCLDPRIGDHYNNPSFGYGGYCLPKDTKQLLANFSDVPNEIIRAIVSANATRKKYIADRVTAGKPETIGIYRLTMKFNSDNFRQSAIQDIIIQLKNAGKKLLIYEPAYNGEEFLGCKIETELQLFKDRSTVILANRITDDLVDVKDKVYTRDLYSRD